MNRTFRLAAMATAAASLALAAGVGSAGPTADAAAPSHATALNVTQAAYTTVGTPVAITAADSSEGITEGVAFSNGLGTVTVLSDSAHRARKVTVTTLYKGLTVKFKSRSGYNYTCSARQQTCFPDRPYAWSWLQFADVEGTTTVRLNPGLGESVPRITEYKGKPSFVFAGNNMSARMVLTSDGLVTYVKKLERTSGYYKFYLKDGTAARCEAASVVNCGFVSSLNWYKAVEVFTGSGSDVPQTVVWRADVQGLAMQAQAAGK